MFVSSKPYSDYLKKLLVINTQDCLDNETSTTIQQEIADMSLAKLRQEGYIKLDSNIKNNLNEDFVCNLNIKNDFEDVSNGIYSGYVMKIQNTNEEKYNFFNPPSF